MAHDLEAVIQGTIVLAVDSLRFCIGDLQQLPSLIVALAALVQLDLHAHEECV